MMMAPDGDVTYAHDVDGDVKIAHEVDEAHYTK